MYNLLFTLWICNDFEYTRMQRNRLDTHVFFGYKRNPTLYTPYRI